ncbi:GTP-binding protein [Hyphomicrobium sp. MC1]|uniref:CobW family GTP-binding protein n=1 Tax=Hyphomicrobium sp. (strain MC1) TaxID=717785 RepID=UPI000213EF92|nr:GTP-binding protein [Hyphomicrobium sp. MC1]CCB65458.1 Cobalamin synthesis protein P47K [Hyphomicrobium sp. MC1]
MTERVAVYLLTGFLGSGKTTLLSGILRDEAFRDTAVIINEYGKVGLDHDLISFSTESTVVMPGGCICCTIREDIETSLRELFEARDSGSIPAFKRIVIETTGIAEPVPLLMTLRANPLAQERLTKPRVLTVVDGVLGLDTLKGYGEAAAQVTSADHIVISKSDLTGEKSLEDLQSAICALNPWASIDLANLLSSPLTKFFNAAPIGSEASTQYDTEDLAVANRSAHRHGNIASFSLSLEKPLDWTAFGVWMTMLLHRHGAQILRVKGLLAVDGLPGPTLFQSAQHLVHTPVHMESWPSDDHRSRIVFIVRDINTEHLEASLRAFDRASRNSVSRRADVRSAGSGGVIAGRPVRRPTTPAWIRG